MTDKTCLSGLSQSHSDRNSQLVVPTYRKPEAIRQLAALLSPSSPLVGENLKVSLYPSLSLSIYILPYLVTTGTAGNGSIQ